MAILVIGMLIGRQIEYNKPCEKEECVVVKCWEDICVGDSVVVKTGVYKGNTAKVTDVSGRGRIDVKFCDGDVDFYFNRGRDELSKVIEVKEVKGLKVGDRYSMNKKDPFLRNLEVEIVEIKEGYVKYKFLSNGGTNSWDIKSFKKIYPVKI